MIGSRQQFARPVRRGEARTIEPFRIEGMENSYLDRVRAMSENKRPVREIARLTYTTEEDVIKVITAFNEYVKVHRL